MAWQALNVAQREWQVWSSLRHCADPFLLNRIAPPFFTEAHIMSRNIPVRALRDRKETQDLSAGGKERTFSRST